jgi:hypothetical protein
MTCRFIPCLLCLPSRRTDPLTAARSVGIRVLSTTAFEEVGNSGCGRHLSPVAERTRGRSSIALRSFLVFGFVEEPYSPPAQFMQAEEICVEAGIIRCAAVQHHQPSGDVDQGIQGCLGRLGQPGI